MDRDAVDAEQREQARDQRRELAGWCREKLGKNPLDWLPPKPEQPKEEQRDLPRS